MGECSKETAFEIMDVRKTACIQARQRTDIHQSTSIHKAATSSTPPMATKTAKARNGLASGLSLAA